MSTAIAAAIVLGVVALGEWADRQARDQEQARHQAARMRLAWWRLERTAKGQGQAQGHGGAAR